MRAPTDIRARDVLTVPQLSRRSGLGGRVLRKAIADSELAAFTPGGTKRPRIFWDDFARWARSQRVTPRSDEARAFVAARVEQVLAREGAAT
jgi:hypothetical protein